MSSTRVLTATLAMALCANATPTFAASTTYPLTIENCGVSVTFDKAPERAVALGQNSAEIMLLLGLEDRMVGTAFWPTKVLPELQEASDSVKLLSVETPSLESVLAEDPDFVSAQLPILMGPDSKVAQREDFDRLGIGNYLAPGICAVTNDTKDAYGSRDYL